MAKVHETQRVILTGAAQKVRVGGRIVYSTCSLEPEEDEDMVTSWLKDHPGFEKVAERKLLPHRDGTDGAYAARLKRIS
jgi:16S rRNA (cytosine967-C5)-methyltransferase